jgi:hypothetical protein
MKIKTLRETPPWEWPGNAGTTIHRALADKQADSSDRLIAAELAGDLVVMDDGLADDLLAIVRDAGESAELRARAAISFGAVLEQADTFGFDDPMDVDEIPIEEDTFDEIKDALHKLYSDADAPKLARRRALEASVRATAEWHNDAVAAAYASGDREWKLTAVFAMRYVSGFQDQILEALRSDDREIHYEAVVAAGSEEMGAAAPHIVTLLRDKRTPKPLLLAAIEAIGSIQPRKAWDNLGKLSESDDEEIAEAAQEAISMAEGAVQMEEDEEDEEEGEEGDWVN